MSRRFALILAALLLAVLPLAALAQTATPTPVPSTALPPLILAPDVFAATTVPAGPPTPGCAPSLPLVEGATAAVRGGTYVRAEPDGSSPWVNYYEQAMEVLIVGGPVCDGLRYNWWQVRGPGNDGWVAEGVPGGYFMRVLSLPDDPNQCEPAAALTAGSRFRLLNDLRVREAADPEALVLTVAPTGELVTVLEGPVCAGNYNWWRVQVVVVNVQYTGWVADRGTDGTPYVEDEFTVDAPVCGRPLNLTVGGQAYVNYKDDELKNLRAAPALNATLVASLLDGIGLEVLGGPVCNDGYNWWQVRVLSRPEVSGWFAEGGPAAYWLSPLRDDLNPVPVAPPYNNG